MRAPQASRRAGDRSTARRVGKLLKELGIPDSAPPTARSDNSKDETTQGAWASVLFPRITVQRARKGYQHAAGKKDIEAMLKFFGERTFYGIKEIRLSQLPQSGRRDGRLFARLYVPGKIVVYEQALSPWHVTGKLSPEDRCALERAGAEVQISDDGLRAMVYWDNESLRDFMLFDVLMHEIGHHLIQHFRGKRSAQVMRSRDHEQAASLFAIKCRALYVSSQGSSRLV